MFRIQIISPLEFDVGLSLLYLLFFSYLLLPFLTFTYLLILLISRLKSLKRNRVTHSVISFLTLVVLRVILAHLPLRDRQMKRNI